MAILYKNFKASIINSLPLLILYYLSISEIDTHFSNMFEILSFNLQIIIIYYWMLKNSNVIGNGHIFFVGIINDVVMGLPLGISAISYLTVSFVASYIRQVTVNISLFTDWFTFLLALFFSNLVYLVLILNIKLLSVVSFPQICAPSRSKYIRNDATACGNMFHYREFHSENLI